MNHTNHLRGLLIDPMTRELLEYCSDGGREWFQNINKTVFPVDKGIVRFLHNNELTGNNREFQKMYDSLSKFYGFLTKFAVLKSGSEEKRLMNYLSELRIHDNDRVIEISIGNGRNIRYLNPNAVYYGLDISAGMLERCRKNMSKLRRSVSLIQAEAENIPVKDESFEVVFSAGGFNYFNDRAKAVKEMLRIAKPGTKLLISDETEKVMDSFKRMPFFGKTFRQKIPGKPADFIPDVCIDVQYREICDGELYVLTFTKP